MGNSGISPGRSKGVRRGKKRMFCVGYRAQAKSTGREKQKEEKDQRS